VVDLLRVRAAAATTDATRARGGLHLGAVARRVLPV
ncbi:MAG: hypothetical protein QOJ55_1573, partial [Solirubrobacteraceae bacterium]|nr:hypothetical protein [Solirubrobacteraceae bacterium]